MMKPKGARVLATAVLLASAIGDVAAAHDTSVVAQYHGSYTCGQGQTDLTLQVLRHAPGTPQQVVFIFGPSSANPHVPHGSFMLKGQLDVGGGAVDLSPANWLQQPNGYVMVGLVGAVTNGGADIRGHVNGGGCTDFDVVRVAD